jgi:hypothetical protein
VIGTEKRPDGDLPNATKPSETKASNARRKNENSSSAMKTTCARRKLPVTKTTNVKR